MRKVRDASFEKLMGIRKDYANNGSIIYIMILVRI